MKRETIKEAAGFVGSILVGSLTTLLIKQNVNPINILDKIVVVGGGFIVGDAVGNVVSDYVEDQVDMVYECIDTFKDIKDAGHVKVEEEK